MIPEHVLTHMAAMFVGATALLGISWFCSLTKRVTNLEAEVEQLELDVADKAKTISRLRVKLAGLGVEESEVEDDQT